MSATAIALMLCLSWPLRRAECKCCPISQCGGSGSGKEILDGVHYLSPPETLLYIVNCYRFPGLSSLPHTLPSFSCTHVSARSSPGNITFLFSLSPYTLLLPCLLTAAPIYYSLTQVKDAWVLSVARLLPWGGGQGFG